MIRTAIFFLWVVLLAAGATLLLAVDGFVSAEAFGWRFDLPVGLAAGLAIAAAALMIGLAAVAREVLTAPRRARMRREVARREKGVAALTRGFEAIAAGDARQALKQADAATRLLAGAPVAKLLTAQAAQLAGDDAASSEALAAMLDAPETEFLALRGLYAKAVKAGDLVAANGHAARAFALHPKAQWALEAVFDLALDRGDFDAAGEALARAAKAKAVSPDAARRGEAATLAASAYAARESDAAAALKRAEAALKLAPGLAPAAVLAARLRVEKGETKKAAMILTEAFAAAPERAVAEAFEEIDCDAPAAVRARAIDQFTEKNPEARESRLLRARALLLRGDASGALRILNGLLNASADARALTLYAEAAAMFEDDAAARSALRRAAVSPRDPALGAGSFLRLTADGWRRLIREYRDHGRLAPPPLEADPPPGSFEPPAHALAPPSAEALGELAPATAPDNNPLTDERLAAEAAAARGVG